MSKPTSPGQSRDRKKERSRDHRRRLIATRPDVVWCPCGWPCAGPFGLTMHRAYMHKGEA